MEWLQPRLMGELVSRKLISPKMDNALGETHRAAYPGHEGKVETRFGPLHVLAHRGLAVAEEPRRSRDGAGIGDGAHDPDRLQVELRIE